MPIGLRVSCWVQLVGALGRVEMYLGLIILLNTYSALFAAIGGRDRVDAGRMTLPFWEASPHIDPGMPSLLLGTVGSDFVWIQMYSECIILIKLLLLFAWSLGGRKGWMRMEHIE